MTFPIQNKDEIFAHPENYRLAVRVPYTTLINANTIYPIELFPHEADEKVAVVLSMLTTNKYTVSDVYEIALVRVLYSPSQNRINSILDVYTGLDTSTLSESQLLSLGFKDNYGNYRFDEIKMSMMLDSKPLILCANATHRRPIFDKRFKGKFDELPWGECLDSVNWSEATNGMLNIKSPIYQPSLLTEKLYSFYNRNSSLEEALTMIWLLNKYQYAFDSILSKLDQISWDVAATQLPFDLKDVVKQRQYLWDGEHRCWHKYVTSEEALQKELVFLTDLYDFERNRVLVKEIKKSPFQAFKLEEYKR